MKYEYEDYDNYYDVTFYHGTSSALHIENVILPAAETGVLREEWRQNLTTKVFFTDSLLSAKKYSKKAALKYGGVPVVYQVMPIGDVWHVNNTEYVSDKAKIINTIG